MNDELLERLLHAGESVTLDYKRAQYLFGSGEPEGQGELLKDILAFANTERIAEAYILIGVEEVPGATRAGVRGVGKHLADNNLQQFVRSKTNRQVLFSYSAYRVDGKQIGVIRIPIQERPVYSTKDFGKVKKGVVYYRLGSSTSIATPEEIVRMGVSAEATKALDSREQSRKQERINVDLHWDTREIFYASIFNAGEIDVYLKHVELTRRVIRPGEARPRDSYTTSLQLLTKDGKHACDIVCRKEAKFFLPKMPSTVLREFADSPPPDVWLSISTFAGELERVEGERIISVLRPAAGVLEAMEKKATPRTVEISFYPAGALSQGALRCLGSTRATYRYHPEAKSTDTTIAELPPGVSLTSEESSQLLSQIFKEERVIGQIGNYAWRID